MIFYNFIANWKPLTLKEALSLLRYIRTNHTRVSLNIDSWEKTVGFKKIFLFHSKLQTGKKILCLCNYFNTRSLM